jgi:hypothetical protein
MIKKKILSSEISRGTHKLTQIPILIKKKIVFYMHSYLKIPIIYLFMIKSCNTFVFHK